MYSINNESIKLVNIDMKSYTKPTMQILSASTDTFIAASIGGGESNNSDTAPRTAEGNVRRSNWGNLWEEDE